MSAFLALVSREITLAVRTGGAGLGISFFVLTLAFLPFAIGSEPQMLSRIGPGFTFLVALFAQLLTLERLVQADLEDGTLDLLATADLSLELIFFGKALSHWISVGLAITLISPIAALLLGASAHATRDLVLALAIGLPGFSALGAMIAALTAGVRRGSLLVALLVLPLGVPFLILGSGAASGRGFASFLFLGALSLLTLAVSLLLGPSALKSQLE